MEKVESGIRGAAADLESDAEHAMAFADAILTTDTKRKSASAAFRTKNGTCVISGVCKGSGMIGPRMALPGKFLGKSLHATMLAYLTTDAAIAPPLLRKLLGAATQSSFNAVTVDDHMSTNDTACILASGLGVKIDSAAAIKSFSAALNDVCQSLAYQIAADGEGATKVVTITVRQARSDAAAKAIARAIANSPLVKCAMNGNDPNWGRIVSAAGLAGVPFDPDKCTLTLQGRIVFRSGQPVEFDAALVSESLGAAEVKVDLACRLGSASATCWTCDLSKDYVTINADYHT
jgi:glutamate N-acetyltransferase/amino-acid N-acetyltransferase